MVVLEVQQSSEIIEIHNEREDERSNRLVDARRRNLYRERQRANEGRNRFSAGQIANVQEVEA